MRNETPCAETIVRTPTEFVRRVRNRGMMKLDRLRLELLRRTRGGTVWTRRGGNWLPYHGDGDAQELQYQLEGEWWFEFESQRLAPYLPAGGVVIDVGANLGFTTLIFARHVGATGRIFAFEPSSLVYPKLLEVIGKNQLQNVECFKLGCGAKPKTETLLVPRSSGNATIKRDGVQPEGMLREVTIEIDTLDRVMLPLVQKVDFLKIDTEGFEDEVLAGADALIAQHRPVIYIELSHEYADSSARAITWLKERHYRFDHDPDLTSARNGDNFLAFP